MTDLPLPEPAAGYGAGCNIELTIGQHLYTADQLHAYAAAKTAEIEAECARLRAFVADLAENGTRFDLNPAVLHIGGNSAPSYLGYIRRIDDSMRERADAALRGKESK